jgi:MFS transporter, DHA3 family, multidrug efflux protein
MKTFYHLLANSLVANTVTFTIWSTAIYWAYLETESVLATSTIGGLYLGIVAITGLWLGSIVDHKKTAIIVSNIATVIFFAAALITYTLSPVSAFQTIGSVHLWAVILFILLGVTAGNIRSIAVPTIVTFLVPADRRDKANGLSGTVFGAGFIVSNVFAGVGLGYLGMFWMLVAALVITTLPIIHLLFIRIDEPVKTSENKDNKPGKIDIRGTISAIRSIPGLFPLIFFTTFNNFLGGIFIAIMDAYGLTLVSVQEWGLLWGVLGFGFVFGGLFIAKFGLGKNPVRTLFNINLAIWAICMIMTAQPSIILLGVCVFIYLCLAPFIEAAEQTIIQKVVPQERQGRVFGFAQSLEQSASPVTAFVIGPIAQFIFIPFMTTGAGVDLIGSWYGVGPGRGLGLVFTVAGIIGLIVTFFARRSRSAKALAKAYHQEEVVTAPTKL